MLPKIYDRHGNLQSRAWVYERYGFIDALPPVRKPRDGGSRFALVELRETRGDVLTVTVLTANGPLAGQKAILHWPDAPPLPKAGWLQRGAISTTDREGRAVHILGEGARYRPPTIGPHALWLNGINVSHMVTGLGTVDGWHLAPTFRLLGEDEPLDANPVSEAVALLTGASRHLGAAIDDVAAAMDRLGAIPDPARYEPD